MTDIESSLIRAVCDGNIQQAKYILQSCSLSDYPRWSNGYDLLMDAIKMGDMRMIKLILSNGCKVHSNNSDFMDTPFSLAIQNFDRFYNNSKFSFMDLVTYLLDNGAHLNTHNSSGYTPLCLAVSNKLYSLTKALLDLGAEVNLCTADGCSPLLIAVKIRNLVLVTLLLDRGAKTNTICKKSFKNVLHKTKKCVTPLHIAAENGDCDIGDVLIQRGAVVNAVNDRNETPLYLAVRSGEESMVSLLINSGADVHHRNATGESLLYLAVKYNNNEITQLLLNEGVTVNGSDEAETLLSVSINRRNTQMTKLLLLYKLIPDNLSDSDRNSLLRVAVREDMYEIADLLLESKKCVRKATKNTRPLSRIVKKVESVSKHSLPRLSHLRKAASVMNVNYINIPPIHIAVQNGNKKMCGVLLQAGTNPNVTNETGQTPLIVALSALWLRKNCECLMLDICDLLLNSGADPNLSDQDNAFPLILAARYNFQKIASLLLKNNASVNKTSKQNTTALFIAASQENKSFCELLLNAGADPNITNDDGESPLLAVVKGNTDDRNKNAICELLLKFRADPNVTNLQGEFPLHCAVLENMYDTAKLLLENKADSNHIFNPEKTLTKQKLHNGTIRKYKQLKKLMRFKKDSKTVKLHGVPLLHLAIETCKQEIVELLLHYRADVNKRTEDNINPIYRSAAKGCEKMFSLLIGYKAEVDVLIEEENKTILNHAVEKGCSLIVEYILKHCNVVKENYAGLLKTALIMTLKKEQNFDLLNCCSDDCCDKKPNYRRVIKQLVNNGFCLDPGDVEDGMILVAVIKYEYNKIFDELLDYGLNINRSIVSSVWVHSDDKIDTVHLKDEFGLSEENLNDQSESQELKIYQYKRTLLHTAVKYKRKDFVKVLINLGAKTHKLDSERKSALFYAVQNRDSKITELILESSKMTLVSPDRDSFHLAVWLGIIEIVKLFLRYGYNFCDKFHKAALHYVVNKGDLDHDDRHLPETVESDRVEVTKLLLLDGTHINNELIDEVMLAAVNRNSPKIVEFFLEYGFDANRIFQFEHLLSPAYLPSNFFKRSTAVYTTYVSISNFSLLHVASAIASASEIVQLLLNWGSYVDWCNDSGATALHVAVSRGNLKSVEILLRHGASTSLMDKHRMTPLNLAFQNSVTNVFSCLLENGADVGGIDGYLNERLDIDEMKMLHKHIFKFIVADLVLKQSYLSLPTDRRALDFQEKCAFEVAIMKSERICRFDITFYDILAWSSSKLQGYVKNEIFRNMLDSEFLFQKFPLYYGLIRSKLRNAEKRRKLQKKSENIFRDITPALPQLCILKINSYLSDEVLGKLISASFSSTST